MAPIDDAEILARYGLESFGAMSFGNGDEAITDSSERSRSEQRGELMLDGAHDMSMTRQSRLGHSRQGSSVGRRRRQARGNGSNEYGDDDEDDDEDDDDEDEYGAGQYTDSMSAGGASAHNLAISDRDPLHVYNSVAAVLESKGDRHALSDMAYRAKFSVSNRNFAPSLFMQVIHSDTSY
ncbi:hypothetical protein GGH95_003059, partial [Coemansia sp. RSA 1836]